MDVDKIYYKLNFKFICALVEMNRDLLLIREVKLLKT